MKNLPNWVLTNPFPSFYDSESGTAIQQTAKVYAAMQELIKEHNSFMEQLNNTINEINCDNQKFKESITQIVENYIKVIDEKIKLQDEEISKYGDNLIKQAIEEGKIVAEPEYEEGTENLSIKISFKE